MPKKNYKESADMITLKKYNDAFYRRQAIFDKQLKKHLDGVISFVSGKSAIIPLKINIV